MGKINMKGGTPHGWASLCTTCTWAHIVTGFRESELVVICMEVNPNLTVPFKVKDCTNYLDRNRPSYFPAQNSFPEAARGFGGRSGRKKDSPWSGGVL